MVSHLVFYQLGLIVLVWVFLMLSGLWPSAPAAARPMLPKPLRPRGKYSKQPKPFPGLPRQPCCTACEQAIETPRLQPSPPPLPTITSTRGRRRHVDTSRHFCPDPACRSGGWLGLGHIPSNGLPTICQAEFVTFFAPSALRAHNESGWHHNTYDDAAWPSGYAGVGRQYCVRPGHAAVPSPVTPYTPG